MDTVNYHSAKEKLETHYDNRLTQLHKTRNEDAFSVGFRKYLDDRMSALGTLNLIFDKKTGRKRI